MPRQASSAAAGLGEQHSGRLGANARFCREEVRLPGSSLSRGDEPRLRVASGSRVEAGDSQLIKDGTYYVVFEGETVAICGGWSRRATLYDGDHTPGRDPDLLDPTVDAARVRAIHQPGRRPPWRGPADLSLSEQAAEDKVFNASDSWRRWPANRFPEPANTEYRRPVTETCGGESSAAGREVRRRAT